MYKFLFFGERERETKTLDAFEWVIIALTKVVKTKDELFQLVCVHSAWVCGFSALYKILYVTSLYVSELIGIITFDLRGQGGQNGGQICKN